MQMKNNYDIEWEQDGELGTRHIQWRNGHNNKNKQHNRNNRSKL